MSSGNICSAALILAFAYSLPQLGEPGTLNWDGFQLQPPEFYQRGTPRACCQRTCKTVVRVQ